MLVRSPKNFYAFSSEFSWVHLLSAQALVTWSACIVIQGTSGNGAFKLDTTGTTEPSFAAPIVSGDVAHANAFQTVDLPGLLRKAFAGKTSSQLAGVDALSSELRAFEGPWPYLCSPAGPYALGSPSLNSTGDALFELRPHGPSATSPVWGGDPAFAVPNGVPGGARRLKANRWR